MNACLEPDGEKMAKKRLIGERAKLLHGKQQIEQKETCFVSRRKKQTRRNCSWPGLTLASHCDALSTASIYSAFSSRIFPLQKITHGSKLKTTGRSGIAEGIERSKIKDRICARKNEHKERDQTSGSKQDEAYQFHTSLPLFRSPHVWRELCTTIFRFLSQIV
jgi:hypothetical protein